jgi:hypothetical protein
MRQALKPHPDSLTSIVTRIDVGIARPRAGRLLLSYVVAGKVSHLRLPPVTAAARADELWQHTCFEAFFRPLPGEAYYEFNFAPSTQWAAYRFDGYRSGMRLATETGAPAIEVRSEPGRYTLRALLELDRVLRPATGPARSGTNGGPAGRLGLSAMIEEASGRKSYWALAHPPGKPDFHHADCFAHEFS